MSRVRPEHTGPAELFYNSSEAKKYTSNSHIIAVQSELAERALELLTLPQDKECLLLDIGCGSGLSGEVLTEGGHVWFGVDISEAMLDVAEEREVEGDLMLQDVGLGIPFRPGTFDGAVSISAIQWLCNAETKEQKPRKRLYRFFSSLYAALGRGSRVVLQFYPENSCQAELITQQAQRAGFTGGLVVDYPNSSKAKKVYLVLFTGGPQRLPSALGDENGAKVEKSTFSSARNTSKFCRGVRKSERPYKQSKEWIEHKRQQAINRGDDVRRSSKYTGRKRKRKF